MFKKWLSVAAIALSLALGQFALPALAADAAVTDPAAKQVQIFHDVLLDTMKRGHELGVQGRFKMLEPAIETDFDLPIMMQFIVGPSWATMPDSDRKSLIDAFLRMTAASYASNFASFSGQRFDIDPNVLQRGADKVVQTTLVPVGEKPVPLLYRMRQSGDQWKIIDVFLEGYVSELATRRSNFAATLAAGGAPALAKKMNDLADSLLAGHKAQP